MSAVWAMKELRRQMVRPAPLLAIAAAAGCADSSNYAAVYVEADEETRLADERSHAYRVTVFEYSNRIGGFIEFFEIDGVRNTRTNPYFETTSCAYFGDGETADGEFAIGCPNSGASFCARAFLIDRRRSLRIEVVEDADTWIGTPGMVTLERVADSVARECPPL